MNEQLSTQDLFTIHSDVGFRIIKTKMTGYKDELPIGTVGTVVESEDVDCFVLRVEHPTGLLYHLRRNAEGWEFADENTPTNVYPLISYRWVKDNAGDEREKSDKVPLTKAELAAERKKNNDAVKRMYRLKHKGDK